MVSSKYREHFAMEFYEFEFLSTHDHMLLRDRLGKVSDFLQELNVVRGTGGKFFTDERGIQTVRRDERVFKASIYTLANALPAERRRWGWRRQEASLGSSARAGSAKLRPTRR